MFHHQTLHSVLHARFEGKRINTRSRLHLKDNIDDDQARSQRQQRIFLFGHTRATKSVIHLHKHGIDPFTIRLVAAWL